MRERITSLTKGQIIVSVIGKRDRYTGENQICSTHLNHSFALMGQAHHAHTKIGFKFRRNKKKSTSWRQNGRKRASRSRGQVNNAFRNTTALRKIQKCKKCCLHLYSSRPCHRFEQEAEAVRADVQVNSLQSALDESTRKYAKFKKVCWNLQYWKLSTGDEEETRLVWNANKSRWQQQEEMEEFTVLVLQRKEHCIKNLLYLLVPITYFSNIGWHFSLALVASSVTFRNNILDNLFLFLLT